MKAGVAGREAHSTEIVAACEETAEVEYQPRVFL